MSPVYATELTRLWPHNQVPARMWDASPWHTILVCSWILRWEISAPKYCWVKDWYPASWKWWPIPACPCRDDPGWMVWGLQRCLMSSVTLLGWLQHINNWEQNHPVWRSHFCSTIREGRCTPYNMENSPMHHEMPDVSLELYLLPSMNIDNQWSTGACYMFQCNHPQQPHYLLQPPPTPDHLWQTPSTGLSYFDGHK